MIYKKMAKFLFIGLLFIGVPSIYAMENDKIVADPNRSNDVRVSTLRQEEAHAQMLHEAPERVGEGEYEEINDSLSKMSIEDYMEIQINRVIEEMKSDAEEQMAKEDAGRLEETRLNDLLVDPNTSKEVRSEILVQREANTRIIQEGREKFFERMRTLVYSHPLAQRINDACSGTTTLEGLATNLTLVKDELQWALKYLKAYHKKNFEELNAKGDAARIEEQRLNNLLADPTTPKNDIAEAVRQREDNAQVLKKAVQEFLNLDQMAQSFLVVINNFSLYFADAERANFLELKAVEKDAKIEEQGLNDLLADSNAPKEVKMKVLQEKEVKAQAFQVIRQKFEANILLFQTFQHLFEIQGENEEACVMQ